METLHWEIMKRRMFHFRKVKKFNKKKLFLTFLTSALEKLINTTKKMIRKI